MAVNKFEVFKGVVFFAVGYKILEALGIVKPPTDQAQLDKLKKEADEKLKVQQLTRPASEYTSAANTIWNALKYSALDDDKDVADSAFTTIINNDADLAYLKQVYGIRPTYQFGIEEGQFDLFTTLKREYGQWRIDRTNTILKAKGVNINL